MNEHDRKPGQRQRRHALSLGLALLLILVSCSGYRSFREAQHAELTGDWDTAVLRYMELVTEDPADLRYRAGLLRAKTQAAHAHFEAGKEAAGGRPRPRRAAGDAARRPTRPDEPVRPHRTGEDPDPKIESSGLRPEDDLPAQGRGPRRRADAAHPESACPTNRSPSTSRTRPSWRSTARWGRRSASTWCSITRLRDAADRARARSSCAR